jgi:glutamate synthase (NADPH) small chain
MGKPTGFLEKTRQLPDNQPVKERIKHYDEFVQEVSEESITTQASRCMGLWSAFLPQWLSAWEYYTRI